MSSARTSEMDPSIGDVRSSVSASAQLLAGIFFVALGVFLLSGPGRIDIIDGQIRFDVARNWLETGKPELLDPVLIGYGLRGSDGRVYAGYNAAASFVALPLVALGRALGDPAGELQRFLFSWTGALFGAGVVVVLLAWLVDLGVPVRRATAFALLAAFASYLWPLAATTFDQIQHTFFLAFGLFAAGRAGARQSAAWAAVSGAAFGLLLNYQENYLLLWPPALLLLARGERLSERRLRLRFLAHLLPILLGAVAFLEYNKARFGVAYFFAREPIAVVHPPLLGNPIVGLVSLLFSPGKSILLYSPTLLLGLLGWRALAKRDRTLSRSILLASVTQLLFISCFTFFGSDWAWGPRYLGPLLPLWILPAALWRPSTLAVRRASRALIVAAVGVQLLGLSLDDHRFFFEHRLGPFFWYEAPWSYFQISALASRPGEIRRAWEERRDPARLPFVNGPYPGLLTYTEFGHPPLAQVQDWIGNFRVYHLPRPWPLWMTAIERPRRPVDLTLAVALCATMISLGALLTSRGLWELRSPPSARAG